MRSIYHRRRKRQGRAYILAERRFREFTDRLSRRDRTARRLGVQLVAWGVCPACGCIGAPNHQCDRSRWQSGPEGLRT